MRQFLLAAALIATPVIAFTGFTLFSSRSSVAVAPLGDMSPFKTIIADVQTFAATGDLKAAEGRITDFETAWDKDAAAMRPLDTMAWGNVDTAADVALDALRAGVPVAGDVTASLSTLMAELDNPALVPGGNIAAMVTPTAVAGVAVTDANGRALPCEDMLKQVAAALGTAKLPAADTAIATDFQSKALERCNSDDDQRADAFSAQALAILVK